MKESYVQGAEKRRAQRLLNAAAAAPSCPSATLPTYLATLTHVLIYIYLLTYICTHVYLCIFVMVYLHFCTCVQISSKVAGWQKGGEM